MSDTPRTDAVSWWVHNERGGLAVPADFARKLERENAALKADKERLDWLQQHGHFGYVIGTKRADCWTVDLPLGEKTTLRAAIDAARKEQL